MMMLNEIKQTIDKDLLRKRFRCASKTYNTHAVVQKQMAGVLADSAQQYIPAKAGKMFELGCGTGLLTQEMVRRFRPVTYGANDLVAEVEEGLCEIVKQNSMASFEFFQGDAENIPIPQKQNVICSGATIQWIQDLDAFFIRMSESLCENGFLAISSFDVENFKEVKTLTGQGIDYLPMQDVFMYASKYFKVLKNESWERTLWFDTPKDVLKHMRFTGVNAVSNIKWGKSDLAQFESGYELYRKTQGCPLSYHPFVLILQRK